jgi:hypothetical protein
LLFPFFALDSQEPDAGLGLDLRDLVLLLFVRVFLVSLVALLSTFLLAFLGRICYVDFERFNVFVCCDWGLEWLAMFFLEVMIIFYKDYNKL